MLPWAGAMWTILIAAFGGWIAWSWINAVRGVARTAPLVYLVPPVAGTVAWFAMGEAFGPLKIVGALVALAGVAWAQWRGGPAVPRPAAPAPAALAKRAMADSAAGMRQEANFASTQNAATTATIRLQKWQPDAPYAARMRSAEAGDVYRIYLDERASYAQSTAFFLDVADVLFEKLQHEE